jgi:hypothetical protein
VNRLLKNHGGPNYHDSLVIPNAPGGTLVLQEGRTVAHISINAPDVVVTFLPYESYAEVKETVLNLILTAIERRFALSGQPIPPRPYATLTAPYGPAYEAAKSIPVRSRPFTRMGVPECLLIALQEPEATGAISFNEANNTVAIALHPEALAYAQMPHVTRF